MYFLYDHYSIEPLNNEISIFGLTIAYYAISIALGIFIAVFLGLKEGEKIGLKKDDILDGVLYTVPLAIVGARIYYIIFSWNDTNWTLLKMLGLDGNGLSGLAIHGGIIASAIFIYFYTKRKKMNIFKVGDITAVGFLVAQACGRWGNFFNQEAHGGVIGGVDETGAALLTLDEQRETLWYLPRFIKDQMFITRGGSTAPIDAYYHPTFLYESVWNLIGFALALYLRRTKKIDIGDILCGYFIWYGVGRFFIEMARTDALMMFDLIKVAQLISLIMIVVGVAGLILKRKFLKLPKYYEVLEEFITTEDSKEEPETI